MIASRRINKAINNSIEVDGDRRVVTIRTLNRIINLIHTKGVILLWDNAFSYFSSKEETTIFYKL